MEYKMMNEMIAYCGLDCFPCPIYLVTREKDEKKKEEMKIGIIHECQKRYGIELKLEDVTDCDGCRTEGGRLFSGCKECPIRNCAGDKSVENCAYCEDYPCEKLEKFFVKDPEAKERLVQIRRKL
jgi:hypothetical protein